MTPKKWRKPQSPGSVRVCTSADTKYPRLIRGHVRRVWRIWTPGGYFVPYMIGPTESSVWEKYCRVMGKSRAEFEAEGYWATDWKPGDEKERQHGT